MQKLYENYHSNRHLQKRIISDDDFTYQYLLTLLKNENLLGKKILDIGCGVGTIGLYLASRGANVLGIDVSKNGIKIAKANSRKFGLEKLLKFEVSKFPQKMPKQKFDIVICSEILEHLEDDSLAVEKIKGLLNKNGLVIASSPSKNSLLYKMGVLNKFDREVGHLRRYTGESYRNLFKSTGFKILRLNKNEGFIRDFLFTNDFGGQALRLLNKWPFSKILTLIDNLTVPFFGESDIILVAKKT